MTGPLALGRACRLAAGASVADSVIWADDTIGEGARVHGSVLAGGVAVPAGAVWESRVEIAPTGRSPG